MKKELIIRKIHLEGFMDLLMSLYEDGVLFFDIIASTNVEQDKIKVVVRDEYFGEEEEEWEEEKPAQLTDDFLNSII